MKQKLSGSAPSGVGVSRREQPEVADANESPWKYVKEKASNELRCGQTDRPVGDRLRIDPGTEGNGLRIEGKDALVGDGGAMGVAAEIVVHVHGALEGRFGVGVPFDSSQTTEEASKSCGLFELPGVFWKGELALPEGLCESLEEFAAQDFCESPYGN